MSSYPSALKKPKLEPILLKEEDEEEKEVVAAVEKVEDGISTRKEQEEAFLALIEHRTKEVEHLRRRISYYQSQLSEAEKRLHVSESQLARFRRQDIIMPSKCSEMKNIKVKRESNCPTHFDEDLSRPTLLIPDVSQKMVTPLNAVESSMGTSDSAGAQSIQVDAIPNDAGKLKERKFRRVSSEKRAVEGKDKGAKRKHVQKEHKELIPLIRTCNSPKMVQYHNSSYIHSQHKRKLRNLALCPVNDQLLVTSALDGLVRLWQIQGKGSGASVVSMTDCLTQMQRRWPENMAWHPDGNTLISVYNADPGDPQISLLDLNKSHQGGDRIAFLKERPHVKGIIYSINFMPWEVPCFVTGGSDHAVICWNESDGAESWKPNTLHRQFHGSAVTGVAGMPHNHTVLSVGSDKKIIGYDTISERCSFKYQIDFKCMSVLPNPCDFNLYMVQTGAPGKQLRLFDMRLREHEIHWFGWNQVSSESQSGLINQDWSPDGLYLSSGSVDSVIHLFDIRFNASKPCQSIDAHQKRVFKALWLRSIPFLVSISSDLNIGLHKIS